MKSENRRSRAPGWRSLLVFVAFALIATFLISTEHRAHALGLLPFLLILVLCPLLHLFMHGGHGGHGSAGGDDGDQASGAAENAASPHRH